MTKQTTIVVIGSLRVKRLLGFSTKVEVELNAQVDIIKKMTESFDNENYVMFTKWYPIVWVHAREKETIVGIIVIQK